VALQLAIACLQSHAPPTAESEQLHRTNTSWNNFVALHFHVRPGERWLHRHTPFDLATVLHGILPPMPPTARKTFPGTPLNINSADRSRQLSNEEGDGKISLLDNLVRVRGHVVYVESCGDEIAKNQRKYQNETGLKNEDPVEFHDGYG
jgi:hypothetical protein